MAKQQKTLEEIQNDPVNRNEINKIKFYARWSRKAKTLIDDYLASQSKTIEKLTYGDLSAIKKLMEDAKKKEKAQASDSPMVLTD